MNNTHSYYEILRVSPQASDAQIKRAYHLLAKKFHPDANLHNPKVAALRFKLINEAYTALRSQDKRREYNKTAHINAHNDNSKSFGFLSRMSKILRAQKPKAQTR